MKRHGFYMASVLLMALTLVLGLLVAQPPQTAQAAALTVDNTTDGNDGSCSDGDCSLREAIAAAAGGDTITFAAGLSGGTIVLGSTLTLARDVTIDGSALASAITVSGPGASCTTCFRVFYVNTGVTATLNRLTIADGKANGDYGGGVYNQGTLTVTNSTLSGNTAGYGSGGIHNDGTLTVTNSSFSDNSGNYGGGIGNYGTLTVTASAFSENSAGSSGGGIHSNYGTVTVTNSTFSGNSASNSGGGISNNDTLTVTNSTFAGNSASTGGGIANNVATTLRNTILANSTSGGNCSGGLTNGGNNLDDGATCGFGSANGSLSNTDPQLGALTGSPAYFPLDSDSPALDGVTYNAPNGCPSTDQRGMARPQGAYCDIGSFEFEYAPTLAATTADGLICTGESTTVVIDLAAVTNLYGYQFQVSYNPTYASASGAFVDSFFDVNTNGSVPGGWNAACAAGVCQFAKSEVAPDPAVSGSGRLAQITLTGVAPGTFDMAISEDILSDIDGAALPHNVSAPLPITVCGFATVSGNVTLQGRPGNNNDAGTVTLTEQDVPPNFAGPYSGPFSATDGWFSIANVPYMPTGSLYTIAAAHSLYLTNTQTVMVTGDLTGQNARLWGGDANSDGKVSIADLGCIGGDFGSTPPASTCGGGGSPDINGDGTVNIQDLTIAGGNFDKASPQPW